MQDQRTASTLELVVNEQQLQNMSRIDLSPSGINQADQGNASQNDKKFSFCHIKNWPTRFRESFNAKVEDAKSRTESKAEFTFELIHIFSSTLIWTLCFILTTLVPVIMFLVGLLNLDNCEDRPSLPYLVFATGFVMTASNVFNLALALDLPILTNHRNLTEDIKNITSSIINIIFNVVVAILYILCGYMVFCMSYGRQDSQADETVNCNRFLYLFTFWFIVLTIGSLVALGLIAAFCMVYNRYRMAIIRGSTP